MKKKRFHDMLRNVIRDFVTMSGHRMLDDMIDRDRDREIELPLRRKSQLRFR